MSACGAKVQRIRGWWVIPEWRGRGVGSALLNRAVCESTARNLEIRTRAVELAQRFGFELSGRNWGEVAELVRRE